MAFGALYVQDPVLAKCLGEPGRGLGARQRLTERISWPS